MNRFYGVLALLVLAASAGYAALVLYSASWPAAAALRQFYQWEPRAYTAAEFWGLRRGLVVLAAAAGLGCVGGVYGTQGRPAGSALRREVAGILRALRLSWRALRPGQRRLAGGLLLALTALRVYYSLVIAPADDAVSYEVFVRASLLTVSATYPFPNNHVLSNTLAWVFYQVYPGYWWSMHLPVLLISTVATVGWFLGLLRRSNFRIALVAVGLFSVTQLAFYHSITGRGYALLGGLVAIGFFALLELSAGGARRLEEGRPAGRRRQQVAWTGLVLSGVAGLYVVPTHAYFLVSAYSWLGVQAVQGRAWGALGRAVGLGLLTVVGAGLLYAPLLLLSGPELLLHNGYVQSLPVGEFWRVVPTYLWYNEGWLSGHRWLGMVPLLVVLAGFVIRRRAGSTGPPPAAAASWGQLLPLSGWLMGAPYLLVLVQRVQPPERTLFYKAQFFFLLVAVLVEWGLRREQAHARRQWTQRFLLLGGLCFAGSQFLFLERLNRLQQGLWRTYTAGGQWLAHQPVGPVLAPAPVHRFVLRFYAHSQLRHQPWQIDDQPQPGVHYRYLVSKSGAHQVPGGPAVAGAPAHHNELLDIFVAP